jgi:RNA-directed DNA polymerase
MASTTTTDKVQDLQRTLYRAAKADPGRRFHALYDKVWRRDVLERAWEQVRRNGGASGIDQQTIADVEAYGVSRLLDELADELREQRYRPVPARRVWIPKPGTREQRPLAIPAVRDRVVQAAVTLVIEPVFEADFLPCSFGFRPKRRAHDALQVLIDETWRGKRWLVETDIASCFEAIPHDGLLAAIEERIVDQSMLKLLRALLRAGVMEGGTVTKAATGTPQGGVISPLLANIYLHRLERVWREAGVGVLVRYADDLVVLCRTERDASEALARLTAMLADLGVTPKAAKTRIVHLVEGGEGVDFLGFHHRWVRGKTAKSRHFQFLARWPSDQAMQRMRDRMRDLTDRRRVRVPVAEIVAEMNRALWGWASYFRHGNSTLRFAAIRAYALMRLALMIAKRHHRSRRHGWHGLTHQSSTQVGLISLDGIVVAPRPNWVWRG